MTEPIQTTQQNAISSVEKELFQGQTHLSLEEKYQKLQQAYYNVCHERDLLRRVIKVYAAHVGTGIDSD
jgi:hypothetical protein